MTDLVSRLASGRHRIAFRRAGSALELKDAIDRGYVLLEFTETRGGTQLGIPLDAAACDTQAADFTASRGSVHLEGNLELDGVRVRMQADLHLESLLGEGHLALRSAPNDAPNDAPRAALTHAHVEAP